MVARLTPAPWEAALLVGAAYRVWVLLALDAILETPRAWLIDRAPDALVDWLECPWCSGFWIGGCWWAAWWWEPGWTTAVAWPFAASAALATIAKYVRSEA